MPKNKKKFIDKKTAITFHLVHRSQQDPLVADENAPQHVLLHTSDAVHSQHIKNGESDRKVEQKKFGIYFDDDYDYLQHLREYKPNFVLEPSIDNSKKNSNLTLPSSVFASEVEEDVGLLNRAVPQSGLRLDLDPDIVAAMDEDFDYSDAENELEDNFIELANGVGNEKTYLLEEVCSSDESSHGEKDESEREDYSSEFDEVASLDNEDTKTRFTEYSMTSSVIHRNQQLSLLDNRFEQMMAGYSDLEIGALDCDEIEGDLDVESELIFQLAEEDIQNKPRKLDTDGNQLVVVANIESSGEDEDKILVPVIEKDHWDCESVLTTYSNLYNHPKMISEPQINKIRVNNKTGIPEASNRLTKKNLATLGSQNTHGPASIVSAISMLSIRNKDEPLEEKKARKKALKQYRKERRVERKLNSDAFKEEKKRMEKTMRNNKGSVQTVHL